MTLTPSGPVFSYAGFWIRAAARLIDLAALLAAFNLFFLLDRLGARAGLWAVGGLFDGFARGADLSAEDVLRGLFFLAFPLFYYVYLHGTYGQTFGKMALRIRVLHEDGTPIGYRTSFLRWLGYLLCDVTLNLGYLWAAVDRRKQGLHDKLCRTIVVKDSGRPRP
jgi:uncharacterized RDD family membrane protein YckC